MEEEQKVIVENILKIKIVIIGVGVEFMIKDEIGVEKGKKIKNLVEKVNR